MCRDGGGGSERVVFLRQNTPSEFAHGEFTGGAVDTEIPTTGTEKADVPVNRVLLLVVVPCHEI